jgi:hypothetical protein
MAIGVSTFVAECFWAGLREEDLPAVGRRIEAAIGVVADGGSVSYLGWLLVPDDEVVLVLFEGPRAAVQRVAEHAGLPFGRILQVAHAPWPVNPHTDEEAKQ